MLYHLPPSFITTRLHTHILIQISINQDLRKKHSLKISNNEVEPIKETKHSREKRHTHTLTNSHLSSFLLLPNRGSLAGAAPTMMAKIESDQLSQLRNIFARFDMDHDGSLTQLELAALLRSLGLKPSGDQIHHLLANIDANGNGSIEFDELVVAIMPDMNEEVLLNQDQLMEVFRSFDRDGNGYITAAELAGQMAKMGHPLNYRELSEMMREADTNGDGVLSFNEFATILGKSAVEFLGLQSDSSSS